EYPCDHYTAIINVTLMCTGCPRAPVHESALQLLQLLDKRFFGSIGPLPADDDTIPQTDFGYGDQCTTVCEQTKVHPLTLTVRWDGSFDTTGKR
ncbi:jg26449, partial [Pararge aegeria aegeria]